jgi:hypothetical protein
MQLEIDALKEAAAWPGADRHTPVVLASQLNAAEFYQEGGMGLTSVPATDSIMGAVAARQAATSAFDHGLSVGCAVAVVVGALLAGAFLPAQPPQLPGPEHHLAELTATTSDGKDLVR